MAHSDLRKAVQRREQSARRIRKATAIAGTGAFVTGGLLTVALANGGLHTTTSAPGTSGATTTQYAEDDSGSDDGVVTTTVPAAPAPAVQGQGSVTTSGGSGH